MNKQELNKLYHLIDTKLALFCDESIPYFLTDTDYIKYLDIPKDFKYNQIPKNLISKFETIEADHGGKKMAQYHQFNCLKLIQFALGKIIKEYPSSMLDLFLENYNRIIEEMQINNYDYVMCNFMYLQGRQIVNFSDRKDN